jgi:hypothetical protein
LARGAIAKENVLKKIAQAFGADFLGESDKKIYLSVDDGGEKVAIAISMTCPKTCPLFGDAPTAQKKIDFEESVEITQEEQENIAKMMERLGL